MRALFVAADGGPRETLAPVALQCGASLSDIAQDAAEAETHWARLIASERAVVLVVGTSDSARGRLVETAARRAARAARIPVVAIEDFPGNYCEVPGGAASLLMVESEVARDICIAKLGSPAPRVEVAIAARYDPYRARLGELRHNTAQRWAREQHSLKVLWAGQPETDDCIRTLTALLPLFRLSGVDLLFKAHPRDPGYSSGVYHALLRDGAIAFSDVTHSGVEEVLETGPRLVVTQFSSVAIEAGFFGIPSLWVLLPIAGGARLEQKKGYAVPPLCLAKGAAAATEERSLPEAFQRALADIDYRENLMCCFDDYYTVHQPGAADVMSRLLDAAGAK